MTLNTLALYNRPVPQSYINFVLEHIEPKPDVPSALVELESCFLVASRRGEDTYEARHPLVQEIAYSHIPDDGPLSKSELHRRAARFYASLRKQHEAWLTIEDVQPQLREFYHLVRAGDHDDAARLVEELDSGYLSIWGYYTDLIQMRSQLLDRLSTDALDHVNRGRLAAAHQVLGQEDRALEHFARAVVLAHKVGDQHYEHRWLGEMGDAYLAIDEVARAIECRREAYSIAHALGDRRGEARHLGELGWALSFNDDPDDLREAARCSEQALEIARDERDRQTELDQLVNLSNHYGDLRRPADAIACGVEGLSLAHESQDKKRESQILTGLGRTYLWTGEIGKAMEVLLEALRIDRQIGYREGEAADLTHLGRCCRYLGQPRSALRYFRAALAVDIEVLDSKTSQSIDLIDLGDSYLDLGDADRAIDHYGRALEAVQGRNPRSRQTWTMMVDAALTRGEMGEARAHAEKLIGSIEERQTSEYSAACAGLGECHLYSGRVVNAGFWYGQAHSAGSRDTDCAGLLGLATISVIEGKWDEGLAYARSALVLRGETLGQVPRPFGECYELAMAQLLSAQTDEALATYRQAIQTCSARGVLRREIRRLRVLEHLVCGVQDAVALLEASTKATP